MQQPHARATRLLVAPPQHGSSTSSLSTGNVIDPNDAHWLPTSADAPCWVSHHKFADLGEAAARSFVRVLQQVGDDEQLPPVVEQHFAYRTAAAATCEVEVALFHLKKNELDPLSLRGLLAGTPMAYLLRVLVITADTTMAGFQTYSDAPPTDVLASARHLLSTCPWMTTPRPALKRARSSSSSSTDEHD